MRRPTLILVVIVSLLTLALWQSTARTSRLRIDRDRLAANQHALLGEIKTYRLRDSLHGVSVQALTLRAAEVENQFRGLASLARELGLKLKRVESLSEATTESRYKVQASVRDTIVLAAPAQVVRYHDPHISLEGVIRNSHFEGSVACRDTLTQIVHRVPRRFLFIRYGTKEFRQEIISSNPHTRIVYARHIRVEK